MTYILYNPLADSGNGRRGLDGVLAAYADEGPETVDVTAADVGAFLGGLTEEDKVVLLGGDGTINCFVNALDGAVPSVPVYAWRFGNGNDFLRDVTDGAAGSAPRAVLINDHIGGLPVVEAGGQARRFLNGCSVGVDAVVCRLVNESRSRPGKASYVKLAIRTIFGVYRPVGGRVTVDGVTHEYKKLWLAVSMNGRYQGGGMKFAPMQDRASDTLTCMVWHDMPALTTLLRFPSVIPGKHVKYRDACEFFTGREITVELDAPTDLQYDGEVLSGVTGYTARK